MNINNKETNFLIRTEITENFIRDIRRIPEINSEEEQKLFIKIEESKKRVNDSINTPEYNIVKRVEENYQLKLRNEIISRNLRFNFALCKRYDNNDNIMDLVNFGTEGMIEAFETYDYKKGVRFCTYAAWYIRRKINHFLTKENIMVRTTNDAKLLPKVKKIENEFFGKEGRFPTPEEIKIIIEEKYNLNNIDINDLRTITTISIDANINSDDDENISIKEVSDYAMSTASYNDYEDTINNDHLKRQLTVCLNKLSERERIIICMSNGYGYDKEYKDQEIAEELSITSERVRQLRHCGTNKMKQMLSLAY